MPGVFELVDIGPDFGLPGQLVDCRLSAAGATGVQFGGHERQRTLRLKFDDGALEISAETPDIGEAREAIPAPFKGEALEIGFNPEFLQDGLDSAESEELILKLISPHRPGLIQSGDDGGFLYLVMPVRLNV